MPCSSVSYSPHVAYHVPSTYLSSGSKLIIIALQYRLRTQLNYLRIRQMSNVSKILKIAIDCNP